jgi:protein-tyrosine kinase
MEHIQQAIERAKGSAAADPKMQQQTRAATLQPQLDAKGTNQTAGKKVDLNGAYLESKRIISHDIKDARTRSFDMLRTQVLQSMDEKSWQLLGVTSPTPGCGKSLIAVNLALSIARLSERSVLLIDMDLQKPQVANTLGFKCNQGLMSVLEGRTTLSSALIQAHIRNQHFLVLPCETSTLDSSEWMASRSMSALLQDIKRDFRGWTVILDLPPILPSDDVISILPQIDSVLFVVGIGTTKVAEIKECNKHLDATPIVRVVVNKATDAASTYYYGDYGHKPATQLNTLSQN